MKLTSRQERLLKLTFIDFVQVSEFLEAPLIVDKAEGLYYWDQSGKRYFDAIGGIYVAVLGHRHPRVMEAMRRQMEKITFAPPLHGTSNVTLDFIERLGAVTPENLNYIKPFSGGSESTEAAMKFVRQYFKQTGHPGKYKFISFYQAYHGATFGAMAASGWGKRKAKFEPQMNGFIKAFLPHHFRDVFSSWDEANRFAAKMAEDIMINEDPDTIAAVLIEPICNTGGIITPTDEFFSMLKESCRRHNIILIYDEVITGYARTGNMFAAQSFGAVPDIICAGKGLSSGAIPLGAMMAREDMKDAFFGMPEDEIQFAHGHTFAGNPLACAVGVAVLDEIVENKLDVKARRLGDYLAKKLEGLKTLGVVREIRGRGMIRGVELVRNMQSLEPFPELGMALKKTSLDNGIILRINPDWFAVAPALIADESDIDEMVELIEKSLKDALKVVGKPR
ncbi:MAG: aspartate aminotransferase family protein [Deltaproteobacteria bacterium]|nr:aspartate aminotransferase family protein [Deltaproteobacteria bacterium]MBW2153385.1 aspartate aminotransferase family protein [Deltaproteobacteria bacterium]